MRSGLRRAAWWAVAHWLHACVALFYVDRRWAGGTAVGIWAACVSGVVPAPSLGGRALIFIAVSATSVSVRSSKDPDRWS